ncbi:tetratricopeptide repeat protein [bacterium]|nr:MAG: tetratricopeptide repeat protein [bacterium]
MPGRSLLPFLLLAGAGCLPAPARGVAASLASADRALHRGRAEEAERALADLSAAPRVSAAQRAEAGRLEGELRLQQGRPQEAAASFERARDAAEKAYGPASPEARAARLDVADAKAAAGETREAERLYRAWADGRGGELAERLSELALGSQSRGRAAEAERLYRAAVEETESALGKGDPLTAARLSDWGLQLQRMERFADAEAAYRRALAIVEKASPPGHPRRDAALNAWGLFLEGRGRNAEAEEVYRRALKEAGPRRSEAGRSYGSLLRRLGREAEAAAAEAKAPAGPR